MPQRRHFAGGRPKLDDAPVATSRSAAVSPGAPSASNANGDLHNDHALRSSRVSRVDDHSRNACDARATAPSSESAACCGAGGGRGSTNGTPASTSATSRLGSAPDEVDPLDAYMLGMQTELKEDLSSIGTGVKRRYDGHDTGVESSADGSTFSDHAQRWSGSKGAVCLDLKRQHNKKMNAMRGPMTD
eukprot:TRINITY_DN19809_c0_g2_i1.p2 TRINITY_DN19809_c0_g2~~TRINITY_DN19809_c0_g2_i1.p2  ORF type:complete len:188 (+),score=25.00 TRINITY_DN19809_c0_g2_i1:101-664(+)